MPAHIQDIHPCGLKIGTQLDLNKQRTFSPNKYFEYSEFIAKHVSNIY